MSSTICVAISARLLSTQPHLRGFAEACYFSRRIALAYAMGLMIAIPNLVLHRLTMELTGDVATGCAALYAVYLAVVLALTVYLYHYGLVHCEASKEDALDAFDALVRMKLPIALQKALGRNIAPLRYAFGIGMGFQLLGLDAAAARVRTNQPMTKALAELFFHAVLSLGGIPCLCFHAASKHSGSD